MPRPPDSRDPPDDARPADPRGPALAVALAYRRDKDPAPRVVAKGRDAVAARIVELAREHGIEVRADRELAQLLSQIDLDSPIPVEAYVAVAEIMSYIYRVGRRSPTARQPEGTSP